MPATLIITLLLLTIRPVDGGNRPRKEELRQPVSAVYTFEKPTRGFHPQKD